VRPAGHARAGTRIAAAAALAILLAVSRPIAAQSGPLIARAASVSGAALVYTGNSGGAFTLSAGFLLNPGDRIDTRSGGRVVVDLSDGSMFVVQPQSIVVLKDFRQAESLRELFAILAGAVRVKINHFAGRPNPYRMNSPTASIAVRGTEFTIEVGPSGETRVMVYEGVVQVTSLSDPNQSVLVEAGRGVLVEVGQDFHLLGAAGNPAAAHPAADRDHRGSQAAGDADQADNIPPPAPPNPPAGAVAPTSHGDRDSATPRATASAYDSYIASLSDIAQVPFLLRFNAFPEAHLDSLENPAYATQFDTAEARIFILPTYGGGPDVTGREAAALGPTGLLPGSYSVSPQLSIFTPIGGSKFFAGGSISGSRVNNNAATSARDEDPVPLGQSPALNQITGNSYSNFYSGSLVLARRLGASSFGFELEDLRGSGSLSNTSTDADVQRSTEQISAASTVSQTRLTAGFSHDFGRTTTLGVHYRYGFISADDHDLSHTINNLPVTLNSTGSTGHSSEIGFRLRGLLRPRLFYGITGAWEEISLANSLVRTGVVNSSQQDRGALGSIGFGIGYLLSHRTVLTLDSAGGTSRLAAARTENATGNLLQNGTANSHFLSTHAAVQVDLSRRIFVSVAYLNVWHAQHWNVDLFPDSFGSTSLVQDSFLPLTPSAYQLASHFSDFGIGWRFSTNCFAQYLFTTDYGVTAPSHTLMLRYTFKLHKQE
jgi:hypothetical protein